MSDTLQLTPHEKRLVAQYEEMRHSWSLAHQRTMFLANMLDPTVQDLQDLHAFLKDRGIEGERIEGQQLAVTPIPFRHYVKVPYVDEPRVSVGKVVQKRPWWRVW